MKFSIKLLLATFLIFACQDMVFSQSKRKRPSSRSSKSASGMKSYNKTTTQSPGGGPCGLAVDPVYYGVVVFSGTNILANLTSGTYTVPAGGVTSVRVFGNYGWMDSRTSAGAFRYDNSGSGWNVQEGDIITITTGLGPKEAIAYYYDNYVSDAPLYPHYFGTSEQLNLGGGYGIKSIKIADGCRVEVNGTFYTGSISSGIDTYSANLYHLKKSDPSKYMKP